MFIFNAAIRHTITRRSSCLLIKAEGMFSEYRITVCPTIAVRVPFSCHFLSSDPTLS